MARPLFMTPFYVSSFTDLADLCKRFNVKAAVCDIEPETRQVRSFQTDSRFKVWLCDYQEHTTHTGVQWNEDTGIVKVNRTEMLDTVHDHFSTGKIILPRRSSEIVRSNNSNFFSTFQSKLGGKW